MGLDFFDPFKISLEMAHKVICTQKKIISRIFKISGTLIVIKLLNKQYSSLLYFFTLNYRFKIKDQFLDSELTKHILLVQYLLYSI
jgi:hypothetical protein